MQNLAGASVYSSCFTDGIGTIYFDAVNGWTAGSTETGANYKLKIEYATETNDGSLPTDENATDGVDWYANLVWKPVPASGIKVFKRDGTSGFAQESVAQNIIPLAIKNGGTVDNFYRIAVTLNETKPARFRIVRESCDPDWTEDWSFVILDNIIVSIPPISAELAPTGAYDSENADKRGETLMGQELATSVAFPAVGATDVRGRARKIVHETGLMKCKGKDGKPLDAAGFVSAAKMHYRWRYLNQEINPAKKGAVDQWKVVDLNPMLGFKSTTPLELPKREGDIEFWYDCVLKTPYYEYVDYSGTGLGVPMTEEVPVWTNRVSLANLPTMGTDWFFRLRRGKSDNEGFRIIAQTAQPTNDYGCVNLELVSDHLWRGFLITTNAIASGLRFRLEQMRPKNPEDTGFEIETNCLKVARNITELPASVAYEPGAKDVWNTLVCDAATGYIQFQLDDSTGSMTVSHADRQDFNRWHDAHDTMGCFVGNSTDTNSMSGVSAKMRDFKETFATWTDTPETNRNWREAFDVASTTTFGKQYTTFKKFLSATTPNGWISGPGMWVNQQWKKDTASGALQMEGQGNGSLEYPSMTENPRGLKSATYRTRLAQDIQFGDIAYKDADSKLSMTNYTFAAQAVMSDEGWTYNTETKKDEGVDDFDGAGQISVVACYRPNVGCYEFRVTRTDERTISLELFKWTMKSGVMKATSLSGGPQSVGPFSDSKNTPFRKWKVYNTTDYQYPLLYISVQTESDGSKKIQAGYSKGRTELGTAIPTGNYMSLCYWDANSPLKGGTYGVASANCNAIFAYPRSYGSSVTWNGGTTKDSCVKKLDHAVGFPAGTPISEESAIYGDIWALCDARMCALEKTTEGTKPRWGLRADVVDQPIVFEFKATGSNVWKPLWTNMVSGFTLSEPQTKYFHRTTNGTYRVSHGATMDDVRTDVVVDEVEFLQWGGDSFGSNDTKSYEGYDRASGWRDRFVFTSGWVSGHTVELNAKRTTVGKPASIRSPLMDGQDGRGEGLGMISFKYKNVCEGANVLVQIATNNVRGTAVAETQSIDPAVWDTVTNFPASFLGSSGAQTVYLGLHGVSGLMRIVLDPKTVVAAQASSNPNYGRIDITEVFCRDEPKLDLASWWGWNIRTFGCDNNSKWDDGQRTYLADYSQGSGASGLSLALNNSTTEDTIEGEEEYYKRHMPFVQTPTFVSNIVGEVTFRARMFATTTPAQKAEVRLYGARSGEADDWTELEHFVVSNTYYEAYHFRSPAATYRAFRLGVSGVPLVDPAQRGEDPTEIDPATGKTAKTPVRVMIEDLIVSEAVYPRVGFRYAYPVRTNLDNNRISPAVFEPWAEANCDEQPLVGENWTVQAEIEVKQLPDEVDLDTPGHEPRVYFHWFVGESPWGYAQWSGRDDAKTAELVRAEGEKMVFRGSFPKAPTAIAEEIEGNAKIVQYATSVVYWDRSGEIHTSVLEKSEWTRPSWYGSVDHNANKPYFSAFSIFESIAPKRAWINEVNVFDGETSQLKLPAETNQYIEIAVPAGQSLDGWRLEFVDKTLKSPTTLCIFGAGSVPVSKKTHETNDYVFLVVQSPKTKDAGTWANVKRPDGTKVEIDGTWINYDERGGKLGQYDPFVLRLVRRSEIVEQEIALAGWNYWAEQSFGDPTTAQFAEKYNAKFPGAKCHVAGEEAGNTTVVGLKGRSLGVFRNIGATSNDWNNTMHQTPGWCNEGQLVPENYAILPNGSMVIVTAKLDGSGHIRQTLGSEVATLDNVRVTTQKGGPGTNITYFIDTWYESAGVTTNGVPMADLPPEAMKPEFSSFTVNVGKGCSNNLTVVASARPWNKLVTEYGLKEGHRYKEAVLDWLHSGENLFGEPFAHPGEIHLADYYDTSGNFVTNLSLTAMYWLDMDPTAPNWRFVAGVSAPTPVEKPTNVAPATKMFATSSIEPPPPMTGITTNGVNIRVVLTMYMTNTLSGASYAPYVLRGATPGSTSEDHQRYGSSNWDSATFKMTGDIQNDKPMRERWVPLRWFYFLPDAGQANRSASFNADNQAVVDVWDPFDAARSGTTTGWELYIDSPVFYSWAIDERSIPTTVEVLKPDSKFK